MNLEMKKLETRKFCDVFIKHIKKIKLLPNSSP